MASLTGPYKFLGWGAVLTDLPDPVCGPAMPPLLFITQRVTQAGALIQGHPGSRTMFGWGLRVKSHPNEIPD